MFAVFNCFAYYLILVVLLYGYTLVRKFVRKFSYYWWCVRKLLQGSLSSIFCLDASLLGLYGHGKDSGVCC
jgi:hypothetical protein